MAVSKKKKVKKNVVYGRATIKATFNNTIVTIADEKGDTVSWCSTGTVGFKGAKKGTPFAAQQAAQYAAEKAIECGMTSIDVFVKGPGAGRETAIRAIQAAGINIKSINGEILSSKKSPQVTFSTLE